MAADARYHLKINGKGYVIIDESYAVQPQRPFNPRFSTGDPSLGDLSFWQFLGQESFAGGEGQLEFDDTTKYKYSSGFSNIGGKLKLSQLVAEVTLNGAKTLVQTSPLVALKPRLMRYGSQLIFITGNGAGTAGDDTDTGTLLLDGSDTVIQQLDCLDACPALRECGTIVQSEHIIATLTTGGAGNVDSFRAFIDYTRTATGAFTTAGKIVPLGGRRFLIINDAGIDAYVLTFNSAAYTMASAVRVSFTSGVFNTGMCSGYGIDANGTVYIARRRTTGARGSTLYRMTVADSIATAPQFSDLDHYEDFTISSIQSNRQGSVYLFGAIHHPNGKSEQAILKHPRTIVWRSNELLSPSNGDGHLIHATFGDSSNEILFISHSDGSPCDSIFSISTSDSVFEVAALPKKDYVSGANPNWTGVASLNGVYYAYSPTAGKFYRTSTTIGQPVAPEIRLSGMGANTPLIKKSLYSILISLSEALPADVKMLVTSGGATVGEVTSTSGTEVEIFPENEISNTAFEIKIAFSGQNNWPGEIKKITARYIPTQFKKLAWGFAVRATKGLKLLNGHFEEREPDEIIADLKAAWAANAPLEFVDIDENTYSVIVTEFKVRMPLAADKSKDREFLVALELLEV